MSGESAQSQELKPMEAGESLPRILRPNCGALLCSIVAIVLGLYMTDSFFWPDGAARKLDFDTVIGWLLVPGGIYLMVGYSKEWLRVTDRGFEWHELFRHRELTWSTVRKLEWEPVHGTVCLRFFSDAGKLSMFLSQFREADRPWLMQLMRESVPADRQEGWERIVAMQARQSGEPVRNGDRGLGIAAALGFIFALILWLAMLGEVPRAWGKFGLMPIIVCPVTFLMSLLDLLRRRTSPWLAAALVLSGLGCVFILMAILHLIRPV